MSGVRTGIIVTIIAIVLRPIQLDHHLALTACYVAVAGTSTRGAAVCRIVAASIPAMGAAFSGCACAFLSKHIHQEIVLSKEGSGIDGVERRREGRTEQARRNKCREERDLGTGFGNGDGILKSENLKN